MWRNGIKCDTLRHIGEIIHFHPNLSEFPTVKLEV